MKGHIELFPAYEVGITGPGAVLRPGGRAHRKKTRTWVEKHRGDDVVRAEDTAACTGERVRLLSLGWVESHGVTPCPEPACFPEARA